MTTPVSGPIFAAVVEAATSTTWKTTLSPSPDSSIGLDAATLAVSTAMPDNLFSLGSPSVSDDLSVLET